MRVHVSYIPRYYTRSNFLNFYKVKIILTSCMSIAVFSNGSTSWFMKSLDGAAPLPVIWVHECPPVKPFPGASMSCAAPAARMPSIAAWSFLRIKSVGCRPVSTESKAYSRVNTQFTMVCGSLLIPKTTFGLSTNRWASSRQNAWNWVVVAAFKSDVSPII